jgi:hypothetical protein
MRSLDAWLNNRRSVSNADCRKMGINMIRTVKPALLVLSIVIGTTTACFAAQQDYHFEVPGQPIKAGHDASFAVKLTQTTTGKVLTNATIAQPKLHMVMGRMDMPVPVKTLSSDEKGNARFSADLSMYGEWTLDLSATIPGEKEPLNATTKFQVVK